MANIEEILGSAKLLEHEVILCTRGDLYAEYEQLEKQLADFDKWEPTKLSEKDPRRAIAEQVEQLQAKMREHEHTFRFRALPARQWSDLQAAHPARDGEEGRWNGLTFPAALVAACAVDPVMSEAQVYALFDVLNEGARDDLFSAAFITNTGKVGIPFSSRASKILETSD